MANTQVRVAGLWRPVGLQAPPLENGGGNGGGEEEPPPPPPPPSDITHGSQLTLADVGPTGGLTASGSIETTAAGQVIENRDVTGIVRVKHANVIIRNCRIRVTSLYGIEIPSQFNGSASFTADHCEVVGQSGQRSACVVHYGQWTMTRCLFSGCEDAVKIGIGGNQHLVECMILDSYYLPPGDPHNDGVQSVGGSDCSIVRCNIAGPFQNQTSAVILQNNNLGLDNWLIEDNLFSGGAFSFYIRDKGAGLPPASNMTVRGNRWVNNSWQFGPTSLDTGPGWVWEDNKTTTGATV